MACSPSEPVQRLALALQCVNHVHDTDGLAVCVLRVRNRVTNDVFNEHLQNTTRLVVHRPRDALHPSSPCKAPDRRLGNASQVVAKDLAMTLGTALPKPLSALATAGHVCWVWRTQGGNRL